jgi:ABC-type Zn uptake system ZnuABC Zn-binding protein ZnuA
MNRVLDNSATLVATGCFLATLVFGSGLLLAREGKLKVVSTSADYVSVAEFLGGERVEVRHIIHGDQDPHTVRPKPSLAQMLAEADLLIATGLDLEMWLPPLIDKSGNGRIREGQAGYVAANYGMSLVELPASYDRSEGDVHCFGNPHVHTSPINVRRAARNIAIGLIKNDPEGEDFYKKRLKKFQDKIDRRLFGKTLVGLVGSKTLIKLAEKGKLHSFLASKSYKGQKLLDQMGGWLKKADPLRGMKAVSYHKNWSYLSALFGVQFIAEVEPKPGIPPSARDVANLIQRMMDEDVEVVFAANYFDENQVARICEKVGAVPVVVPLSVGGVPEVTDYFELVDYWIDSLLAVTK